MIIGIEAGNILLVLLFGIWSTSLLWPLLVPPFSKLQLLGMLVTNAVNIELLLLVKELFLNCNVLSIEGCIGPLFLKFQISSLGLILGLLISIIWPVAYIYSWGYLRKINDSRARQFLFFVNASVSTALLISLTANLVTMFCCYELLTLMTLPLVAHNYNANISGQLRSYLAYLVGGSIILWLPAILFTGYLLNPVTPNATLPFRISEVNFIEGGHNFGHVQPVYVILLLTFFLLGIAKSAIFPMYRWLPAAMVANYPVSALLHTVAVVKVGIFCLIKVLTDVFGLAQLRELLVDFPYFKFLAIAGIISSGILAIRQDNIKKILAYSTVSQLNSLVLATLMLTPGAIKAAIVQMIVHSFTKITLFFICGHIYLQTNATVLPDLKGTYNKMPYTVIAFIIISTGLIGLPISYGSIGKKLIINEAVLTGEFMIIIAMLVGSTSSFIYMSRIIMYMFLPEPVKTDNKAVVSSVPRLVLLQTNRPLQLSITITLMIALFIPILINFITNLIELIK